MQPAHKLNSLRHTVFFAPLPVYAGAKDVNTLRLSYTNSDEAAIEEGIKRLAGAITKMRG